MLPGSGLPAAPQGEQFEIAQEDRTVVWRVQPDANVPEEHREVAVMPSVAFADVLFVKDPSAVKDYWFDWSSVLDSGETITASTWTGGGLTVSGETTLGAKTGAKLGGGALGSVYIVSNAVTTSSGRSYTRQMRISAQLT